MTPASIVVAGILLASLAINGALRWGERRAVRWANETAGEES